KYESVRIGLFGETLSTGQTSADPLDNTAWSMSITSARSRRNCSRPEENAPPSFHPSFFQAGIPVWPTPSGAQRAGHLEHHRVRARRRHGGLWPNGQALLI